MATFRQRGGRWQAIIRRTDLKATKTFDRKGDAQAWARAREREADMADVLPPKMIGTLGPLIDQYVKEMHPLKKWGHNKAHSLKRLQRDLGDRRLEDLTQSAILKWAKAQPLANGSVSSLFSYLREVLKTAKALWATPVPLAEVEAAMATARRMGIAGQSGVRVRRPTPEEIAKIIEEADSRRGAMIDLGDIVRVLAVLPLRLSELLGIQWGDLNADRRTALIRSRKHPDARVKATNHQEVPLIRFGGVDTFGLIAGRQELALESPFPYKSNSVSTAFHQCALRRQIVDLHLHDLRAYSLSRLLEAGMPIPQVALISGHRNWKVLSKHYARIDPTSVHDTLTRLG